MFIPPDLMSVATSPRSPKVAAQTRCPKPGRRGWAAWPRPRHTEPANAVRSESVVSVRECESLAYLQLARRRRIVFNLAPTLSTCATSLADFSDMHRKIEKNVIHSLPGQARVTNLKHLRNTVLRLRALPMPSHFAGQPQSLLDLEHWATTT